MNGFLQGIGNFLHQATAPAVNYFQHNVEQPVGQAFSNLGSAVHNEVQQAPQQIHPLVNFVQQAPQVFGNNLRNIEYQLPSAVHNYVQPLVNSIPQTIGNAYHLGLQQPATPFQGSPTTGQLLTGVGNLLQKVPTNTGAPRLKTPLGNMPASLNDVIAELLGTAAHGFGDTVQHIGQGKGIATAQDALNVIPVGRVAALPESVAAKVAARFAPKLQKEDVALIGKVHELIDQHGGRANLGDLGATYHALATHVFGKDAANWPTSTVKNAFDLVLQKIGTQPNKAGLGLSLNDIRQGATNLSTSAKAIPEISKEKLPVQAQSIFQKEGTHLQNLADQTRASNTSKLPRVENPSGSSIPLPLNPPQKIGWLKQGFNRARNNIASQGPAGQELANNLQKARDVAETTAGNWVHQMPTVSKLSKDEFTNFVDTAEGKAQPINQRVAQAAQEWGKVRDQVYGFAKQNGIDIGKLENYFPHTYDPKIFQDKNLYNQAINHLVQSGQAPDNLEAAKMLRYANDVVRNRRQGNLEFSRVADLPNFEKTKDALFNYVTSAANRIAQVQVHGQGDEKALQLINQIAEQGGDANTVKDLFNTAVGAKKYGELQTKISGGLRAYNTASKLGLGAITNAGQNVNTATVVGGIRTLLQAPRAAFSSEAKDFALKTGTTLDSVVKDLKEGSGISKGFIGKISAPGFNTVEKFNRTLAANAGRDYARSLAAKGDTKALAKMGITLEGNKLTPEQEVQAARNIVERTQFKVDPQDLPGWASSPWGKLVSQFRTFSYNQTAFMKREVIDPALKGNLMPLARFAAIGIPAGAGIQEAKNKLRNRPDETNPAKRVQQAFSQVGGLGLASDIVTGLAPMNGQYLDQNRATTLALGTLGGPTIGNIANAYGSATNAVQGKPQNLERFGLQQIPLVGGTLQNTLLPYKPKGTPASNNSQSAANSISNTGTDLTPVEKAKLESQISDVNAQEKAALADNGVNLPVFGQVGGTNDQQKNNNITQLDAQKQQLQDQLKPKTDYLNQKLTGSANVDEAILSGASSQLSEQQKQTVKDVLSGKLDSQAGDQKLAELKNQQKAIAAKLKDLKISTGETKPKRASIKGVSFKTKEFKPKPITFKSPKTKAPKLPKLRANVKPLAYKGKPFKLKA